VFTSLDHTYMAQALRLAEDGLYTSQPNPHVGCVIVKDGKIIGQGAHLKAGEAHAEVNALQEAGSEAAGADVYVTLEPCNHYGRTAPCAEALVKANVKRVVVAMKDPNPLVSGQGIQFLKSHGITVEVGLMEVEATALNVGFIKRMTHKLPYVRCKLAVSLDGKTALGNGKSHWITGEPARLDVQRWRARSCAVITGIGTVISDNPSMTVRLYEGARQPLRVLVDSQLSVPLDSKMLSEHDLKDYPICIAYAVDRNGNAQSLIDKGVTLLHLPQSTSANTRVDLLALLQTLAMRGCNEVLIEAGHGLNGGFMQASLIDECIIYYAPKVMGGDAMPMFAIKPLTQMSQVVEFTLTDVRQIGQDIRVIANPLIKST
jgi:diaminohydroxyphosphoribosylaminopyrimidine deaminase / 5-amino-6-(5-phosphoribosylamino)uracil reductase